MKEDQIRKLLELGMIAAPGIQIREFNRDEDEDDGGPAAGGSSSDGDDGDDGEDDESDGDGSGAKTGANVQAGDDGAEDDRVKSLEARLEKERKQREKLEAEKKKREDEKKTELERAQERAKLEREKREAAEKQVEAMRRDNALREKLAASGARADRMSAIMRVVDTNSITSDEEGNLLGIEAAVEDAKKEFPEFFGAKSTADASTGGGKSGDRGGSDGEPQTDYEVGRAIAKNTKKKKTRL